jgi:hypothetical protein
MDELTKDADSVSFMIILHKEFVSIHYVLGDVPCDRQIQDSSTEAEKWRNYTWLEVRSDASLHSFQSGLKGGTRSKCAPGNSISGT